MKVHTNEGAVISHGFNPTILPITFAHLPSWSCLGAYHKLETDETTKALRFNKNLEAKNRFLNC